MNKSRRRPIKNNPDASDVYQLKITLQDIHPPIWRRVVVPGNIRLSKLHHVIQETMGWTNSHLHDFFIENKRYSTPDMDFDSEKVYSESTHRLCETAPKKGRIFFTNTTPVTVGGTMCWWRTSAPPRREKRNAPA